MAGTHICQGCLSNDRKITVLDDRLKKQYFLQIILELPTPNLNEIQVLLCWECEALFRRFMKFKTKAQKSYTLLQNNIDKLNYPQNKTSLKTEQLYNLNLQPDTEVNGYKVIKTESLETFPELVKEEDFSNDVYSDHSDEDNKMLIDVCVEEQKQTVKKKRKRKEKDKEEVTIKTEENYRELELSEQEIEEERRQLELREDYVNALFRCEKCIMSFPNADDLKDHFAFKHELNASYWKCETCECSFASEVSYNYHTNKHRRRYECSVCSERFSSKRGATKHFENVHCSRPDMEFEIDEKPYINDQKLDPELDNSIKPELPSFPCEYCNKSFRWKTSLRKHTETHRIETGQKRRPYCEPCRLTFSTTANLQKHVKASSKHQIQLKLRKLKDSTDEVTPEKEQARIDQIKSSVNDVRQMHACGQCDKKFQWKGNLLRHLNSHAARANGELVCAPCNRSFSSIATYQQHMKISRKHVSENDFKYMCSDCGKRFANRTRLKDHVNWEHLKNYIHKCPVCQKVFKSHTSLYLHNQVVHNKDSAKHLCDHCGKPFPNRAKLRCHVIALHTLDAPYSCGSCSARFSWHSCLSRHVRRLHRTKGKADGGVQEQQQ